MVIRNASAFPENQQRVKSATQPELSPDRQMDRRMGCKATWREPKAPAVVSIMMTWFRLRGWLEVLETLRKLKHFCKLGSIFPGLRTQSR